MIDVRKAREILGDHMAIMGDVPATLFAAGTPDDIYAYVRDLVRLRGRRPRVRGDARMMLRCLGRRGRL